jgi:hypothetical protein
LKLGDEKNEELSEDEDEEGGRKDNDDDFIDDVALDNMQVDEE